MISSLDGDDEIVGLRENDRVCTGGGDDTILSTAGWGVDIDLGSGNDRVVAGQVRTVLGGRGDDEMVVGGIATLQGGPGNDLMRAHSAPHTPAYDTPCVVYRTSESPVVVNLARGRARGEGSDRLLGVRCLVGSRHVDVLIGSRRADHIMGNGDHIVGGEGNDIVEGGRLGDRIHLGPGDDHTDATGGRDRVFGGPGNDVLVGGAQSDHLWGGSGDDRVHAGLMCDPGSSMGMGMLDRAPNHVSGGPGSDYLTGDLGSDTLNGGPGYDRGSGGTNGQAHDAIYSVEVYARC